MENLSKLLSAVTYFLGYRENEVEQMTFYGDGLQKGGRQYLDQTMTGVTFNTIAPIATGFILVFDTEYNGEAVVQKTTWGDDTHAMYEQLYRQHYCGIRSAVSDGFIVPTERYGDLLIEMQRTGGMDFIMVSIDGLY